MRATLFYKAVCSIHLDNKELIINNLEEVLKGCQEWKLGGNPWSMYDGNSSDVIAGRLLLLKLLRELAENGWRVICSADTSSRIIQDDDGFNISEDGDSWFLAQINSVP